MDRRDFFKSIFSTVLIGFFGKILPEEKKSTGIFTATELNSKPHKLLKGWRVCGISKYV